MTKQQNSPFQFLLSLPRQVGVLLVRIYQHTLSFDHGPLKALYPNGFCRYYPSCSEYSAQAIKKHGLIIGSILGAWRIMRCNPFSKGGHDPVPESLRGKVKSSKASFKKI